MRIALIDNYDSFTYNLKAQLKNPGAEVDVFRNDKLNFYDLYRYDALVLSPGPSLPKDAGRLLELIDHFKEAKPILGVCLGLQAIAEVFGGQLELLDRPLHGFNKEVRHFGDALFAGIDHDFMAARYHSWVVTKEDIPHDLQVIAVGENKEIMALKHIDLPIYGLQFHPESILTEVGNKITLNFLEKVEAIKNEEVIKQTV